MADYWIKLYHDILDDPKMATLPDNLWRRVIELFLFAGRLYKDGQLPETKQIAWGLRQQENILETELKQIVPTGIIEKSKNGWFIPKFKTRQDPMTNTERTRKFRESKQHEQYNGNETVLKRYVTQITDNRSDQITDNRSDQITDAKDVKVNLAEIYRLNFGEIYNDKLADDIIAIENEYPHDWFSKALEETNKGKDIRNKWKYFKAILEDWRLNGVKASGTSKPEPDKELPKISLEEVLRMEEINKARYANVG